MVLMLRFRWLSERLILLLVLMGYRTRRQAFLDSDSTQIDLGACISVVTIPNILNLRCESIYEAHNK